MDPEPVTYADLARQLADLPPEQQREREYRRGYVDGYVQAVDALHDLLFQHGLSRQAAYELAWNHAMTGDLHRWKMHPEAGAFEFPPARPKLEGQR